MNNTEDILKKILLNMKYMVENKKTIDNLLIEAPTTEPPNGQQIPITMNQIMQFQKYIWSTIEKDIPKVANTCRSKDKKTDCAHNSMLCPATKKPCWKKDAVDGMWGGSTITAWDKYKQKYKAFNPKWWVDDGKTGAELSGQQIPVTTLQTKNFQKWYLEQIEKSKPNLKGLYTTKLCKTPCTYNQAVDGVFGSIGSNTRTLWDTYKDSYMKSNPNWYAEVDFDQNVVRSQEKIMKIQKTFIFTKKNPSGYNGTSTLTDIPKWIVANKNTLFKFDEESATKMANNYGWDINPKLFPPPKEYSQSDFDLFMADDAPEKLKQINNERQDWYSYLEQNKSDRLGAGGTFEKQTSVMTGIPTRGQRYEENWEQRTRQAKGPQYVAGETWNTDFRIVKRVINEKCKRPLMVTGIGDEDAENPLYISYSDICTYAGGLWVWNAGEGPNAYCGCRFMDRKNGLIGEQLFTVKGPNGQDMTVQIDFRSAMEYQTPGGKKDNEEYQAIHDVLTVVELGLIAVSFVAGPAAPLFIGVSALVGVADSAIYFQQGDKYMGIMMMAISMLGIDDVVSLVKYAAAKTTIKTLGKEGIQAIAKKQLAKEVLSESEERAVKEIQTAVYQSQNGLNSSMKLNMMDEFVTTGVYSTAINNSWGWSRFFDMYYKINKRLLSVPSMTFMVIKIGGVAYTVDQVYLAFYGNDEDRKYSSFSQLFDYFKNASEAEKMKESEKAFEVMQKEMAKNPTKYLTPQIIDKALGLDYDAVEPLDEVLAFFNARHNARTQKNNPEKEKIQKDHKFTQAPPLSEVESGESILSWGLSGDSVTEIQNLLKQKGYDIEPNGIFDWDTDFMVNSFQNKNGLNQNGVVDDKTLLKLKGKDESVNCAEKINSWKSSGWVEINKMKKNALISQGKKDKIFEIMCNNETIILYNENYVRSQGESPVLKTIVDNPDLQEMYINFKRFI
jgi:hypothetical protein